MTNLTAETYYQDKTAISHSSLRNFVQYNEYGERIVTPDMYDIFETQGIEKVFANPDIIQVGSIVDKYFEQWPQVLDEYPVVARRWTNPNEITKWMREDIDWMINMWIHFTRFMNFLKTDWTLAQEILIKDIELFDNDWIPHAMKIRGKPDFINYKTKVIVDLKTTASLSNMIKWLSFKWVVNLWANYVRQLSFYNYMAWGDFDGVLAVLTPTEVKWITIPNKILVKAWEQIEQDLIELKKFIDTKEYPDDSLVLRESAIGGNEESLI